MHIAVCDDNLSFLAQMEEHLRTLSLVESVSAFSTLERFLLSVEAGARYDAALLDIHWGQPQNGMDMAARLLQLSPATRIIYITGYGDRFAQQVFLREANLSGFLTKPVDPALLLANLEKAARAGERSPATVTILSQGKPITLPVEEILYLESRGHTVLIHTTSEVLSVYRRLDEVALLLPEGFCRCHKSFLVSLRHIRRVQQPDLLLKNGCTVPVSRTRYAQAKADYLRFIGRCF